MLSLLTADAERDNEEMTKARQLRELLSNTELITAPGAYDCITARMIEQAGFSAVYMTGAGTAAMLGYPDYGFGDDVGNGGECRQDRGGTERACDRGCGHRLWQ
jgi:Phosphoenolpyruvate phosphomutase